MRTQYTLFLSRPQQNIFKQFSHCLFHHGYYYFYPAQNVSSKQQLYNKSAILLTSFMHSRQPYSAQLNYHIFQYLLSNASQVLLTANVFILFPYVNIDGFQLTKDLPPSQIAKYRKNLHESPSPCLASPQSGVDINRNFAHKFGTNANSSHPCSEQYRGESAFSQPQSSSISALFRQFHVVVNIDLHSWGNNWLYPYASDSTDQLIKTHTLYELYLEVQSRFVAEAIPISSCYSLLKYSADGVVPYVLPQEIDWALDQGAFSFAYEVGTTFSNDPDIQHAYAAAVKQMQIIFSYTLPKYRITIDQAKYINVKSLSLNSFQFTLTNKQTQVSNKYSLRPLQSVRVEYEQGVVVIMEVEEMSLKEEIVVMEKEGEHNTTINVLFWVVILLLALLFGIVVMHSKHKKTAHAHVQTYAQQMESQIGV